MNSPFLILHAKGAHYRRQAFLLLAVIAAAAFAGKPLGADVTIQAPNVISISPRLVTSGQPTADALSRLAAKGFGAVIYLASPQIFEHSLQLWTDFAIEKFWFTARPTCVLRA